MLVWQMQIDVCVELSVANVFHILQVTTTQIMLYCLLPFEMHQHTDHDSMQ